MAEYKREPAAIEEMLLAYARTPIVFLHAFTGMPDALALVPPAKGEWSIAQIVTHLWIVDGHLLVAFAGAERPTEGVMRPKNPPAFAARMDEFELRRATVVVALRNLAPELWDTPHLFRTKESTARALITRFVRHDGIHLKQIIATRHAVEAGAHV